MRLLDKPEKPTLILRGIGFQDDGEDDGGGTSDLLTSIFSDAASVTNTAIIANANPVNAAILTNTPLTTASATVGTSSLTSGTSLIWLLVAAVVVFFVVLSER
jgi:hypothetical protein